MNPDHFLAGMISGKDPYMLATFLSRVRPRPTNGTRMVTCVALGVILTSFCITSTPVAAAGPEAQAAVVIRTAYITGFSYYDNTPPGSAAIAYRKRDGYPTAHNRAGGYGSYDRPITLAVGWHTRLGPRWPVGARFYLPYLRKYVIVEDKCGDRAQLGACWRLDNADPGATTWLDVWVNGVGMPRSVSDRCMSRITGIHTAIYRPARGYPVTFGSVTKACREGRIYSDAIPRRRS
jgi:hypothetical protein